MKFKSTIDQYDMMLILITSIFCSQNLHLKGKCIQNRIMRDRTMQRTWYGNIVYVHYANKT